MRVRWMAVFPTSYRVSLFLRRVLTFGTHHGPCHFRVSLYFSSSELSTVAPSRMWPLAKFVALSSRVAVLLSHCFLSTDGERNHVCGAKCAASGTLHFVQWPSVRKHRKRAYSWHLLGRHSLASFSCKGSYQRSVAKEGYIPMWVRQVRQAWRWSRPACFSLFHAILVYCKEKVVDTEHEPFHCGHQYF